MNYKIFIAFQTIAFVVGEFFALLLAVQFFRMAGEYFFFTCAKNSLEFTRLDYFTRAENSLEFIILDYFTCAKNSFAQIFFYARRIHFL